MTGIHRIDVTLAGSRPPIWRRIRVPASIKLSEMHWVAQKMMGWTDSRTHASRRRCVEYGEPDPELEMVDEGA